MAKLFDKWDLDEVEVQDLGLKRFYCRKINEQNHENPKKLW